FSALLAARGHQIEVLTTDTAYLGEAAEAPGVARTLRLHGGWREGTVFNLPEAEIPAVLRHNVAEVERSVARFAPDCCLLGNLDFLGPHVLPTLLGRGVPVLHHLGNQLPGYLVPDTPRTPLYRLAAASDWLAGKVRAQ